MSKIELFFQKLWSFNSPKHLLEGLYFRVLEAFALSYTLYFSWSWAFETIKLTEIVLPLGLANYVEISWWYEIHISIITSVTLSLFTLLAFFRIQAKWSYWIVILLFHLQYAARYSQGEISHGSNFIGTTVFLFAFGFTVFDKIDAVRRFTLGNLYFILGSGYTSAALSKLIGTGISWIDGQHLQLWIAERGIDMLSKFGSFELNILQQNLIEYPKLATFILSFGLICEFFGFLIWFKKTRYWIISLLILMHLGIYWSMNILFDMYIYHLLILLIPYEKIPLEATKHNTLKQFVQHKFVNS